MTDKEAYIFGTKYSIKVGDTISTDIDGNTTMGLCDSSNIVILLATKQPNGDDIPTEELEKNLLHELFHAIFNEGQYLDLGSNEPLVEWCARCVHSLIQQKVI